jgi:membrane protein YdbS with pleckstrin-like domain
MVPASLAGIVGRMTADDGVADGAPSWNGLSPRLRTLRRWQVIAGWLVSLVVTIPIAVAAGSTVAVAIIAGVLTAAGLLADVLVGRRFRAWGYAERAEDLLVKRGVMFRRTSVIPYGRMQYLQVTAGPLERAFGLATVQMHTAAAASDARIPGLASPEAARLRDQLASLGEAQAMGL